MIKKVYSLHLFFLLFTLPILFSGLQAQSHLLITEVAVTSSAREFIEIHNPTAGVISLADYYLSDNADYALLPGADIGDPNVNGPAPSLGSIREFLIRFPAAATISAGGVIVIASDGAGFNTQYGFDADYELKSTSATTTDMITSGQPGLVVGSNANLIHNNGESIVLFTWDGSSDLIQDVDMVNSGTPSAANQLVDKGTISVDGPDVGTTASTYLTDAFSITASATAPSASQSIKRLSLETGNETTTGGNGIGGHDESSESTSTTWDGSGVALTTPNPGSFSVTFPVELLSFEGKAITNHEVELSWVTASEENNSFFSVEISRDRLNFFEMGTKKGAGTTQNLTSYSYMDNQARTGANYYRLKQVDFDGKFAYSDVIEIKVGLTEGYHLSSVFPNPANAIATWDINLPNSGNVDLIILDPLGKTIDQSRTSAEAGQAIITRNISNLSPGMYVYLVKFEGKLLRGKLIKQ